MVHLVGGIARKEKLVGSRHKDSILIGMWASQTWGKTNSLSLVLCLADMRGRGSKDVCGPHFIFFNPILSLTLSPLLYFLVLKISHFLLFHS